MPKLYKLTTSQKTLAGHNLTISSTLPDGLEALAALQRCRVAWETHGLIETFDHDACVYPVIDDARFVDSAGIPMASGTIEVVEG